MKPENNHLTYDGYFPTWCPGCGNFGIWASVKKALQNLKIKPSEIAIVFGIGCSGNSNDFIWTTSFHSLHGRAVPTAIGIKLANHKLPVLVIAGDGDCYGEGGNHLIHAARGNHDITVLVHDNRVYGLTTGQVAPTAYKGQKSKSTPQGIIEVPLNPISLALTQGATFIAQAFSQDIDHTAKLIQEAILHKGFSLVNVFQPCVTFNSINSYSWYRERVYKLDSPDYNSSDFNQALVKSLEIEEKLPIGVIYKLEKGVYTDQLPQLEKEILVKSSITYEIVEKIRKEFI